MRSKLMPRMPAARRPCTAWGGLTHALHAGDRPLDGIVEALHAEACTVHAGLAECINDFVAERTGIDLDGDLGIVCHREAFPQHGHGLQEFLRLKDGGRAAAEMDVAHVQAARQRGGDHLTSRSIVAR